MPTITSCAVCLLVRQDPRAARRRHRARPRTRDLRPRRNHEHDGNHECDRPAHRVAEPQRTQVPLPRSESAGGSIRHERGSFVSRVSAAELVDEVGDGARVAGGRRRRQRACSHIDRVARTAPDRRVARPASTWSEIARRAAARGRVGWCTLQRGGARRERAVHHREERAASSGAGSTGPRMTQSETMRSLTWTNSAAIRSSCATAPT